MPSLALRAALIGLLSTSSASAQSSDLPPFLRLVLQPPASRDLRTDDRRSADAVAVHLALGQSTEARQEAESFLRHYAIARPTGTARVLLQIGASLADEGDWQELHAWMTRSMGPIDRSAPVAEQVQAHALLGRAYSALHKVTEADREYEQVRQRASQLREATEATLAEGDSGTMAMRAALNALGEAHFHFAEKQRVVADSIRVPAYHGGASAKDIQRFVETDLTAWLRKRRKAIEEAEKAYLKVLLVEPAPPPRWVVAAAGRVGLMWAELLRAPRRVKLPAALTRDEELRVAYRSMADRLLVVDRDRAKGASETCLRYALKYQHVDASSRACEAWLVRNYPSEYLSNDVLGASPDHLTLGVTDRAAPLGRGGKPVAR